MKKTHSSRRGTTPSRPTHSEVSARAQLLWEQRGRPAGVDEEIWYEAERQLGGPSVVSDDEKRLADPDTLLDPAGDPADDLDERLKQLADAPGQRSATSL